MNLCDRTRGRSSRNTASERQMRDTWYECPNADNTINLTDTCWRMTKLKDSEVHIIAYKCKELMTPAQLYVVPEPSDTAKDINDNAKHELSMATMDGLDCDRLIPTTTTITITEDRNVDSDVQGGCHATGLCVATLDGRQSD